MGKDDIVFQELGAERTREAWASSKKNFDPKVQKCRLLEDQRARRVGLCMENRRSIMVKWHIILPVSLT